MSKCANCNELAGEEWSANNGLCTTCARDEVSKADTNQASEDEPINQHLVCLWQLQDIEETIADASPEELVDLHSKLVALSTDITEAVQSAIRTEKLNLLAEVRERVIGEDVELNSFEIPMFEEEFVITSVTQQNHLRADQRISLTKLETEL